VIQRRLAGVDINSNRIEILRYLYREGPASTSDITEHVNGLSTTVSVRRALYDLMSLDIKHDDVDERLVVKDSLENKYGMPWQVSQERDERGKVPLRPTTRRTRILDALTARLLEALEDRVDDHRELVADIVDRNVSQTYHMERRAEAFQFPFQQWAKPNRSRHGDVAVVEAIDVFAGATDNLSPRRVAGPLVELLDHNNESELATLLCQYFDDAGRVPMADLPDPPASNDHDREQSANQYSESTDKPDQTTDDTELQVFETNRDAPDETRVDNEQTPDEEDNDP
jgi:hypothetical protein